MTSEELARIKEYCDKQKNISRMAMSEQWRHEDNFAKASRTALPALVAEVERLRGVLAKLDSPELMEKLAAIEHERWSGWMKYQADCLDAEPGAKPYTPDEYRNWWRRLADTDYADLSEIVKESDRKEVRKTLAAIREALK